MEFSQLGSSISLRSFSRLGSQVSVLQNIQLGASVSLRSIASLGSTFSVIGMTRVGSSLSLVDMVAVGSSLSLRSFFRCGESIAIAKIAHIGSSISIRQFGRLGSTFSVLGLSRFGSALSLVDFSNVGSSLSVRGFVRLGSGLSIVGNLIAPQKHIFENLNTYIKEDTTNGLEFYVQGTKALTLETDGGILHGSWNSESVFVTSDRRLKKEIAPLQRTLRSVVPGQDISKPKAVTDSDGALWLLRQLRPVSYSFRKGAESKYMRFGFIADELESVVPQVVRTVGNREVTDQKAVVYQDLIAVLAAAAQSQQQAMEELKTSMEVQLEELRAQIEVLNKMKAEQEVSELRALRAEIEKMKQARNETAELEELKALRGEIERLKQAKQKRQDEIQAAKSLLQQNNTHERTSLRGT